MTFEELFDLEPVYVPHDVKSVRELMLEYDREDIDGWWSFVPDATPMNNSNTNLDFLRIGAFAKLVAEEINYHVDNEHGTCQRIYSIY